MLYALFDYLQDQYNFPGAGVFQYISFRAAMAFILSLIITIVVGKRFIEFLNAKNLGEEIRDLGLEGQAEKKDTPTMGGLIIIAGIVVPVLLFNSLSNVYIQLLLLTVIWLGFIGGVDDYRKKKYKNKEGLAGRYKVFGQVVLAIIVGATLYWHPDVRVKKQIVDNQIINTKIKQLNLDVSTIDYQEFRSTETTVPFLKDNNFNYSNSIFGLGEKWGWLIFIPVVIFIVVAVSNAANFNGDDQVRIIKLMHFILIRTIVIYTKLINYSFYPI